MLGLSRWVEQIQNALEFDLDILISAVMKISVSSLNVDSVMWNKIETSDFLGMSQKENLRAVDFSFESVVLSYLKFQHGNHQQQRLLAGASIVMATFVFRCETQAVYQVRCLGNPRDTAVIKINYITDSLFFGYLMC